MSTVFEAIFCPASRQIVAQSLCNISVASCLRIEVDKPDGAMVMISQDALDEGGIFSKEAKQATEDLSRIFGVVLLVRCDNQNHCRSSACYKDGQEFSKYTEKDEVFVLTDNHEPITLGKRFCIDEIDQSQEYVPLENAIEKGIKDFMAEKRNFRTCIQNP